MKRKYEMHMCAPCQDSTDWKSAYLIGRGLIDGSDDALSIFARHGISTDGCIIRLEEGIFYVLRNALTLEPYFSINVQIPENKIDHQKNNALYILADDLGAFADKPFTFTSDEWLESSVNSPDWTDGTIIVEGCVIRQKNTAEEHVEYLTDASETPEFFTVYAGCKVQCGYLSFAIEDFTDKITAVAYAHYVSRKWTEMHGRNKRADRWLHLNRLFFPEYLPEPPNHSNKEHIISLNLSTKSAEKLVEENKEKRELYQYHAGLFARCIGGNSLIASVPGCLFEYDISNPAMNLHVILPCGTAKNGIRKVVITYDRGEDLLHVAFYRLNMTECLHKLELHTHYTGVSNDIVLDLFKSETGLG